MTEEKDLLQRAIYEIQDLRRRNEVLSAKVEMIDLFSLVLNTKPNYPSQAASEDIAWAMQRRVDVLNASKRNVAEAQ
jgi:hypothetical protein